MNVRYTIYMSTALSQHIIIMGVSGSGKSAVGSLLAERLSLQFFDADDFHSPHNIRTMESGQALQDEDRIQWLADLQAHLIALSKRRVSSILACSVLKAAYRQPFASIPHDIAEISFLYLDVPYSIAHKRLKKRKHHFMPPALLQSQYDTLEIPDAQKEHIRLYTQDASSKNIDEIIAQCEQTIRE